MEPFIPLVVRSHYSLMWGVPGVEQLVRAARRQGYDRLALTDTDNLYGLWSFLAACRREGVTPIVGAELTDPHDPSRGPRATLLVTADEGFRRLCRLLTRRHTDPDFQMTPALGAAAGDGEASGLVLLTSSRALLRELLAAGVPANAALPRRAGPGAARLRDDARRLGVPLVAVPGSFLLTPADRELHQVLRAIDRNTSLSRLGPEDQAPPDAWLASPDEYARRFALFPETLPATVALAERCQGYTGPHHGTVLPPWQDAQGRAAAELLREEAYQGARGRYGDDLAEPVVERLEHELRQIEAKGFSAYFLVVQEIVRASPRTCGRGSGAASLVAYCLGITNVCPLAHNLYFERFLNPGRTDPPDIDVDFAWDERGGVIRQVLARHGAYAAMVCNHVLFQPRMAIREVARVFGLTDAEIGQVSRRLPWFWRTDTLIGDETPENPQELEERLRRMPELRQLDFPEPWPAVLRLAQRLLGTPRLLSVHPGGLVITPRPVADYAPVQQAAKGVPILQWEKDGTEEAGLVKIDLLGNRSLAVIRDAIAGIRDAGLPFEERGWEPEQDLATRELIARGGTMGCFYIESPAMRLLLRKAGRGDFAHLVIFSSIIRPAANDYIREYLRRLAGEAWEPIHPLLADVLDETLGIMVYQEDVSKTAVAVAGFSHSDADALRKVLSKKDRAHRLKDYRARFTAGARARGVSDTQIDGIWAMMMSFDGYSFCKPHSASYARVSCQAAYLKRHHPAPFMAAVISNQGGFYGTFAYVSEARRLGLTIRPPDVTCSRERWTGAGTTLRVGLMAIKALGRATRERIVAARERGDFLSLEDFLERVRPDEAEIRALIQCGGCDSLAGGQDRAALSWRAARWARQRGEARPSPGRGGRTSAAGAGPGDAAVGAALIPGELFTDEAPAPRLPPGNERQRLRDEFAVLGFLCDRHPMVFFREEAARQGALPLAALPGQVGRRVRGAGWLITGKLVSTKRGEPMEFLTFEDETDTVEATFFPRVYREFCDILDWGRPYLLAGRVEEEFGATTLTVERVWGLP